eukprot:tig00000042_g15635.t1
MRPAPSRHTPRPARLARFSEDVAALFQSAGVLLNLTSNAVKYTFNGEVRLSVSVMGGPEAAEVEQGYIPVFFEVQDTGPGIDGESQRQLFSRFFRVRRLPGGLPDPGGTGLGLAISREIVERAGGAIGCESAVGKGSRFWFWVPLRILDPGAEPAPRAVQGLEALAPSPQTQGEVPPLGAGALATAEPAALLPRPDSSQTLHSGRASATMPSGVGSLVAAIASLPGSSSRGGGGGGGASPRGSSSGAFMGPRDSTMSTSTLFREIEIVRGSPLQLSSLPPIAPAHTSSPPSLGDLTSAGGSSSRQHSPTTGRPCRILVVEDNAVNARVLSSMLRREGHEVRAIRALEAERGLARHFIVALTAYATAKDELLCLQAGMDRCPAPADRPRHDSARE